MFFRHPAYRLLVLFLMAGGIGTIWSMGNPSFRAIGQDTNPVDAAGPRPDTSSAASVSNPQPQENTGQEIKIFDLAAQGGIFMWPIYGFSLITLTVIIERLFGLRKSKIMPEGLVAALGQLGSSKNGFDPRRAYRICQEFPSATASVVRSMLLKVGRPHSEVEHTVKEASEREANRLYSNVRWLNLSSSVAPLLGLIGTIQGMIIAFHRTTVLPVGANKATELAGGIYTALVTTFAGLCVAIPASVASHYFEGRIQAMFHFIDEFLFNLMPQIERYEGRVRFNQQLDGQSELEVEEPEAPPVSATRTPAQSAK